MLIRKLTLFLAAAMFSLSAMAGDFNQTQRLANQGNAQAQFNLGVIYEYDNGDQDGCDKYRFFNQR